MADTAKWKPGVVVGVEDITNYEVLKFLRECHQKRPRKRGGAGNAREFVTVATINYLNQLSIGEETDESMMEYLQLLVKHGASREDIAGYLNILPNDADEVAHYIAHGGNIDKAVLDELSALRAKHAEARKKDEKSKTQVEKEDEGKEEEVQAVQPMEE